MSLRIFIVEEYAVLRHGIRSLIEAQPGWKICGEATSSGEAIHKVRDLHPDLLILDVTLRDMDAGEAVSQIMTVCPTVKIVALAEPGAGEPAAKALAAGASGMAMISDTAKDFLDVLQNTGSSHPFLSPAGVLLLRSQLATRKTREGAPTDLTPREIEVLRLLANGLTNKAVAKSLAISVKTVDVHRANIMRKLKMATYSDLIQFAIRHKIIEI